MATKFTVPQGLEIRFARGCPDCGDSLESIPVELPDHGRVRAGTLGWCMDCRAIKMMTIHALVEERVEFGRDSAIPVVVIISEGLFE